MRNTLGQEIRRLRKQLKMTQEELAGTEMTNSHISAIENDKTLPTLSKLKIIAHRLNKPIYYFKSMVVDDRDTQLSELLFRFEAYITSQRYEQAWALDSAIKELLKSCYSPNLNANYTLLRGKLLSFTEKYHEAIYHFRKALDMYQDLDFMHKEILTLYYLGKLYLQINEQQIAINFLEQALETNNKTNITNMTLHKRLLTALAYSYYLVGDIVKADSVYQTLFSSDNTNDEQVSVLLALSETKSQQKDFEAALEYSREAATLARSSEANADYVLSVLMANKHGASVDSKQMLENFLDSMQAIPISKHARTQKKLYEALVAIDNDDCERAQYLLDSIERLISVKDLSMKAKWHDAQATLFRCQGQLNQAIQHLEESAELYKQLGLPYLVYQQQKTMSEILFEGGNPVDAYRKLSSADKSLI